MSGKESSTTVCPTCGARARRRFSSRDFNRRIDTKPFTYFGCDSCGLTFLPQIPPNLGSYYQSEYYVLPKSKTELAQQAGPWELYKIDLVRKYTPSGRLLDIGAGAGRFVFLATEAGYQAEAVEMSIECCEFIRNVIGAPAYPQLEQVPTANQGTYDVVTMWHVLEHMEQPWQALDLAARQVKPGGVLIVAMPNPDSRQFRIFGRYWAHLDAPRHLQLIPHSLLTSQLTSRSQLTLKEVTTTDAGTLGYNTMGWVWSANNVARGGWRVGSVLARWFKNSDSVGMRGSCYTSFFQRPIS